MKRTNTPAIIEALEMKDGGKGRTEEEVNVEFRMLNSECRIKSTKKITRGKKCRIAEDST